jgi:hypothetical protein
MSSFKTFELNWFIFKSYGRRFRYSPLLLFASGKLAIFDLQFLTEECFKVVEISDNIKFLG